MLYDDVEQFPARTQLRKDIDVLVVFDVFVHLHDVRVILRAIIFYHFSQDVKLVDHHFLEADVLPPLDLLHGSDVACVMGGLTCEEVAHLEDLGE